MRRKKSANSGCGGTGGSCCPDSSTQNLSVFSQIFPSYSSAQHLVTKNSALAQIKERWAAMKGAITWILIRLTLFILILLHLITPSRLIHYPSLWICIIFQLIGLSPGSHGLAILRKNCYPNWQAQRLQCRYPLIVHCVQMKLLSVTSLSPPYAYSHWAWNAPVLPLKHLQISDGQVRFGLVLSEFSWTLNQTLGLVQHFGWTLNRTSGSGSARFGSGSLWSKPWTEPKQFQSVSIESFHHPKTKFNDHKLHF